MKNFQKSNIYSLKLIFLMILCFGSASIAQAEINENILKVHKRGRKFILENNNKINSLFEKTLNEIQVEENQKFYFEYKNNLYSFIPIINQSRNNFSSWICAVEIVNADDKLIDVIAAMGNDENRPWTCDGIKSVTFFKSKKPDEIIIVIQYAGTAPSSENFDYLVVLNFSVKKNKILIDELATSQLEKKKFKSIKIAKDFLLNK